MVRLPERLPQSLTAWKRDIKPNIGRAVGKQVLSIFVGGVGNWYYSLGKKSASLSPKIKNVPLACPSNDTFKCKGKLEVYEETNSKGSLQYCL